MKKRLFAATIGLILILALSGCVPKIVIDSNRLTEDQPATQTENEPAKNQPQTSPIPSVNQTDPAPSGEQKVNSPAITKEQAKKIALDHAGVGADQIYGYEIELDREARIWNYELEFKFNRTEYQYDIHAETGEILKAEKDYDD